MAEAADGFVLAAKEGLRRVLFHTEHPRESQSSHSRAHLIWVMREVVRGSSQGGTKDSRDRSGEYVDKLVHL